MKAQNLSRFATLNRPFRDGKAAGRAGCRWDWLTGGSGSTCILSVFAMLCLALIPELLT